MSDVEFDDLRQAGDHLGRLVVEPVAGVAFDPLACGLARGKAEALELVRGARALAVREHLAPGPRVQLDDGRADGLCRAHRLHGRLDEQRHADADLGEFGRRALQMIVAADHV